MLFERKSLNDIVRENPALLVRGDWACLNIDAKMAWPFKPQSFAFEGQTVWVMPCTTDTYPGLAMNRPGDLSRDTAWALLHRALSVIAWTQDRGALVVEMTGGSRPHMLGITRNLDIVVRDEFDLTDLPQIPTERGRLALALMREGRGLNHPAYAFLSFFRALETAIPDGRVRGQWVSDNIGNVEGHRALDALKTLRASVKGDIGLHLRETGRHAIAHAQSDPIINPDDPRDARRLAAEQPLIEALAVLAIEQILQIQASRTIWREHLYELRGWKPVFGTELIAAILAGNPPQVGEVDAPVINVRLRRSSPFFPLERMRPLQIGLGHQKAEVVYQSADGLIDLTFWLNFAQERLEFDPERSIVARDDGSAASARTGKEMERFLREHFGNGELQIWDADTGTLLSRCDAFLPVNAFLDMDAASTNIERWDALIAQRDQKEAQNKA